MCIIGSACGQTEVDTPEPPVCKRTLQVQNEIVAAIAGVNNCSEVTSAQLAEILELHVAGPDVTELKSGDFAGLTRAGFSLNILNTQLQTLPADIFAGISPHIGMSGNPFDEGLPPALIADLKMRTNTVNVVVDLVFVQDTLPASLALTVGNTMDVDLEDAFFYASGFHVRSPASRYEITVADNSAATAAVSGHTLTISAVSGGQTDIDVVGVRRTDTDQRATQTLTVQTYPEPNPPVCSRTLQVRNAIVAAIAGVSACANVTGAQLAEIFALTLTDTGITELKSDDFAGLTRAGMTLSMENTQLQTLPADIFDGISAHLVMTGNSFGAGLPSALIADLKTRRRTIALDLVFVQDTLPASLALTVGNTVDVDLEDAFFYAAGQNTRSPADRYQITVTDESVAQTSLSSHTLTIAAVSAGQTAIDIAGVRSNSEQRVLQTLTVEVPDPVPDPMEVPAENLKFRIKIFLEGAQ